MDNKNFIIQMSRALAWPTALFLVVFILRPNSISYLPDWHYKILTFTSDKNDYSIIQIAAEVLTAVATISATVIALAIAIKNSLDLKEEKLSGIAIESIDRTANVALVNKSKVDVSIKIESRVLCNGKKKNESMGLLKETGEQIRDRISSNANWQLLRDIHLSAGEKISFHLFDVGEAKNVFISYVAIRLIINQTKTKIYICSFAGDQAKDIKQNIGNWVIEHSYLAK